MHTTETDVCGMSKKDAFFMYIAGGCMVGAYFGFVFSLTLFGAPILAAFAGFCFRAMAYDENPKFSTPLFNVISISYTIGFFFGSCILWLSFLSEYSMNNPITYALFSSPFIFFISHAVHDLWRIRKKNSQ